MDTLAMAGWPRAKLTERDVAAIAAIRWRRFSPQTVTAIAQAWNGGLISRHIARDLKCKPGSVRFLIGRLSQVGVAMRLRDEDPFALEGHAPVPAQVRRVLTDHQLTSLSRLAEFDSALRNCAKRAAHDRRRFG